jgi:hypothetical protein
MTLVLFVDVAILRFSLCAILFRCVISTALRATTRVAERSFAEG